MTIGKNIKKQAWKAYCMSYFTKGGSMFVPQAYFY